MGKFIEWLLSLFRFVPKQPDFKSHVLALYPQAVVSEDLLPGSGVELSVVVLPGVPAGFPAALTPYVRSGDGVLTVVVTGGAADYLLKLIGGESLMPDLVRGHLIDLLKASGVVSKLASVAAGARGVLVLGALAAVSPLIVNAIEASLGGFNGCVTVR